MRTLDELIEIAESYAWTICDGERVENDVLECLLELKERQESDLRPADKFLTNDTGQQMNHITEEYCEVVTEYNRSSEERLVEELIDLQMSCETMLANLGLDEQQRREARKKVLAKNAARGYFSKEA